MPVVTVITYHCYEYRVIVTGMIMELVIIIIIIIIVIINDIVVVDWFRPIIYTE